MPEARIFYDVDAMNFRRRRADDGTGREGPWGRVCRRAGLGAVKLKDLRDTYASQLLTCGVSVGWISNQLGHATTDIATKRYARWCGGAEYRDPLTREPGEVPSDFLARLSRDFQEQSRHKVATEPKRRKRVASETIVETDT